MMKPIRFLCIAILGMVVGSAESLPPAGPAAGTNILDFDTIANIGDNIPAMFQPKIYQPAGYNAAEPNNLRYVYFTVFNPGDVEDGNFRHAVVRNPVQTDNNIFFPMDGHQPTAEETGIYSSANVDAYDEASPITAWYMKMFGVIPFRTVENPGADDYIKAGFKKDGTRTRIFEFQTANVYEEFKALFRKIASTPIGRALLYRILIEIRRTLNNEKCFQSGKSRRYCLSILIRSVSNNGLSCRFIGDKIELGREGCKFEITNHNLIVLSNAQGEKHISIFHEMLHWFHCISDEEYSKKTEGRELCHTFSNINDSVLYNKYYNVNDVDADINQIKTSLTWWGCRQFELSQNRVNTEEFRTIAGINNELSENAFRYSLGLPIRVFHTGSSSFDDERTTGRCCVIMSDISNDRYCVLQMPRFSCCNCCAKRSYTFLCLGKEDSAVAQKLRDEASNCCRFYNVECLQQIEYNDLCDVDVSTWHHGIGKGRFFKKED